MLRSEIQILLADDHPIMLKGLEQELAALGYQHIHCASNGFKALEIIQSRKVHVALLDIEMPGLSGFDIARKCQEEEIEVPLIFLSYHKEKTYLAAAKKLGVMGYMLKEDSIENIHNCITHVMKNRFYYSSTLGEQIFQDINGQLNDLQLLTRSEKLILSHIAEGKTSQQIAETLEISKRTIEKHRANIKSKLLFDDQYVSISTWAVKNIQLIRSAIE